MESIVEVVQVVDKTTHDWKGVGVSLKFKACWICQVYQEKTYAGVWFSHLKIEELIGPKNTAEVQGLSSQTALSNLTEHSISWRVSYL